MRIDAAIITTTEAGVVRQQTKTHSKREVAVDGDTVAVVRVHARAMRARARAAGTVVPATAYVFSHAAECCAPWRPDNVSSKWKARRGATASASPVSDSTTCDTLQATVLLGPGVPVKNVSKRLGHRDAATTLNVYAQFVEAADRESADVMGLLLARRDSKCALRSR